jgi:zinc finger CCHC domain-containing protein 8
LGDIERIHVVEGRKQEKLDWLDWFEPGQVRGSLLREALGLAEDKNEGGNVDDDGEWLRNMAVWGYPKGWTGERDPRYEVMRRIEGEDDEDEDGDGEDAFVIFGDAGEQEEITINSSPHPDTKPPIREMLEEGPPSPKIHRWASYPTTHFSSALLPIYSGYALPPLPTESPQFINDAGNIIYGKDLAPRPPSSSPPPLPPPIPPPPAVFQTELQVLGEELDGEAEMDFSDSD